MSIGQHPYRVFGQERERETVAEYWANHSAPVTLSVAERTDVGKGTLKVTECGAHYDDYDGTCELEAGHDGPHAEGRLRWGDSDA